MTFRECLRWDGSVAIVAGLGLCLRRRRRISSPADAVFSGAVMLAGTGVFVVIRHGAPFRRPERLSGRGYAVSVWQRAPWRRMPPIVRPLVAGQATPRSTG